jgi:hypothetical protein
MKIREVRKVERVPLRPKPTGCAAPAGDQLDKPPC